MFFLEINGVRQAAAIIVAVKRDAAVGIAAQLRQVFKGNFLTLHFADFKFIRLQVFQLVVVGRIGFLLDIFGSDSRIVLFVNHKIATFQIDDLSVDVDFADVIIIGNLVALQKGCVQIVAFFKRLHLIVGTQLHRAVFGNALENGNVFHALSLRIKAFAYRIGQRGRGAAAGGKRRNQRCGKNQADGFHGFPFV